MISACLNANRVLFLGLALLSASAAHAGAIVNTAPQTQTFCLGCPEGLFGHESDQPDGVSANQQLTFSQFDSSLGVLRKAVFTITSVFHYYFEVDPLDFENNGGFGPSQLNRGTFTIGLSLENAGALAATLLSFQDVVNLNPEAFFFTESPQNGAKAYDSATEDLSYFVGGATFNVASRLNMLLESDNLTLNGNATWAGPLSADEFENGVVSLVYTYETRDPNPVPEPGTLLLGGLGLLLGARAHSRKKAATA